MRNKGKQKKRLYLLRDKAKKEREKRNKSKRPIIMRGSTNTGILEHNFVGTDYLRVMNHLEENNFAYSRLKYKVKRYENIDIKEVFSFFDNPDHVIQTLRKVYTIGKNKKTRNINFHHENCRNLELAASTTLDVVALAVDRYRDTKKQPLEMEGTLPDDTLAKDILLASGLPHHLHAYSMVSANEEQMERFQVVKGRYDPKAGQADITATDLTNYFNRCLKTQNYELNPDGLSFFGLLLGEVITNCEIHGGENSTWYTQGHYQIREKNTFGEMQLIFLNLGSTIYHGLKHNSSEETKNRVRHILKCHRAFMNQNWDEEMLLTVFALQEGISRLRDEKIEGYAERGTGTVNMIEHFYTIGGNDEGLKPQMTIISGSTQILFTDKYRLENVDFKNDKIFGTGIRKVIAFNPENNIYEPADPENVKKLKEHFPGTVISLKFYLDNRYINKKKAGEH